jgi:small-conductance mechanosensitive channel
MKRSKKKFTTNTVRIMLLWATIFSIILINGAISLAQTNESEKQFAYEESQKRILESQTRLKEEIAKVKAVLELQVPDKPESSPSLARQQFELLQKIDLTYDQQLFELQRSLDLEQTIIKLKEELSAITGDTTWLSLPFSFLQLDEQKEKLVLLEDQRKSVAEAVKTSEDLLQATKEKFKAEEQAFRRIKEEIEAEKKSVKTSRAYTLAELSKRLLAEEVNLQKISLENVNLEQTVNQYKRELTKETISFLESRVTFTRKELRDQILKLEKDALTLKDTLEKAKTNKDFANSRWLKAKEELVGKTFSQNEADKAEKEVIRWKTWNDTYGLEVDFLGKQIENLSTIKKVWEYRYALFNRIPSVDLAGWTKEMENTYEELEREKRLLAVRQTDCNNEMRNLEEELESARTTSKPAPFIEERLEALKPRLTLFKQSLESIQSGQREIQKLQNEIARREKNKSFKDQIAKLWTISYQVWQYEITSVEDQPITVGKIIMALVLLILGLLFSNRLTAQIGKQLVKRIGLTEAAAFAIQQILYYLTLVLLVLFVLSMVRIPLTFFTFVGGALAIGVGFGSQNIVNNFLSGLILMVERPIKIGDIVEAEGVQGTVEWVGARSTIIRTFNNLRLVIPNSTLLQNKVINWSLTDDIVRREIVAGVIYGSPVRKVEELLKQAAGEHSLVEKYPKPLVLFEDFGDNSLVFTLIVWISMARTGRAQIYIRQVESDIRFRIDELFRENHIVIAFPQRDVHLDTLKPLEVRIKQE